MYAFAVTLFILYYATPFIAAAALGFAFLYWIS